MNLNINRVALLCQKVTTVCAEKKQSIAFKINTIKSLLEEESSPAAQGVRELCISLLDNVFTIDENLPGDIEFGNMLICTKGFKALANNAPQLSMMFRIEKTNIMVDVCEFINSFTLTQNMKCEKINIPILLRSMMLKYGDRLKHVQKITIIVLIVYLLATNSILDRIKVNHLCEKQKMNIYSYMSFCYLNVMPEEILLSFNMAFKPAKTDKTEAVALMTKALFVDAICQTDVLLRYLNVFGFRYARVIDFFKTDYEHVFRALRFKYVDPTQSQPRQPSKNDLLSCTELTDKANEMLLLELICTLLKKSHIMQTKVCDTPVLFVHKAMPGDDTDIFVNTIFTCKNTFIATKHKHTVILEGKNQNDSPCLQICFINLNTNLSSSSIVKKLNIPNERRGLSFMLLLGKQLGIESKENPDDLESLQYIESFDFILSEKGLRLYSGETFAETFKKNIKEAKMNFKRMVISSPKVFAKDANEINLKEILGLCCFGFGVVPNTIS